jgi:hypothetical protein
MGQAISIRRGSEVDINHAAAQQGITFYVIYDRSQRVVTGRSTAHDTRPPVISFCRQHAKAVRLAAHRYANRQAERARRGGSVLLLGSPAALCRWRRCKRSRVVLYTRFSAPVRPSAVKADRSPPGHPPGSSACSSTWLVPPITPVSVPYGICGIPRRVNSIVSTCSSRSVLPSARYAARGMS